MSLSRPTLRRSQSTRITGSTRLVDTEKQHMITEAEPYAEADHKRREDAEKLNKRGHFIIDPDGLTQGVGALAEPIGRNVEEMLRQIQAMQAVRANPGMAAPGGWKSWASLIQTGKEHIGSY